MDKKIFIKNRPFDVNDANDMQNWTEDALKKTMASIYSFGIVNGLGVTVNSNLKVNIAAGSAFDSNYDFINVPSNATLTLESANTSPRIDKIVIKYQSLTTNNVDTTNIYGLGTTLVYSQNKKDGYTLSFVKGVPASSPVAPPTPAGSLVLAEVTIPANATSLSQSNIIDRRGYITINSNINTPEVVFSTTPPANTNVLWIDTTNNLPKIYKNSAWVNLNSNDATTLQGNQPGTGANNLLKLDSDGKVPSSNLNSASTTTPGTMSAADKSKLDSIAQNANNYVHPATHPASMITEDASNRFVTDTEKANWNGKADNDISIGAGTGLSGGGNLTANRTLSFNTTWGDTRYLQRSWVDRGMVSVTPSGANVTTSKTVTFSKTFPGIPTVVATANSEAGTLVNFVGVSDITTTGFKIHLNRGNTTDTWVNWIALYE